jgi:phosphohistidine phosphatase SixA
MAALGQVVFSLALGGTFMVTYGSYLGAEANIRTDAALTVAGDTLAGLLAGLALFPAVFALGLEPGSGPGLLFATVPEVFARLPAGWLFGTLFFGSLSGAALLSGIAAYEVLVVGLSDSLGWSRPRAVRSVGIAALLLALPPMINLRIFVPWDLTFGSGGQTLGAVLAVGHATRGPAASARWGRSDPPRLLPHALASVGHSHGDSGRLDLVAPHGGSGRRAGGVASPGPPPYPSFPPNPESGVTTMRRGLLGLCLFALFPAGCSVAVQNDVVVYLVRHAERAEDGTNDPPLSDAGSERAELLANMLKDAGVTHIHSTDFKRTLATGRPLSEASGIEMASYDPRDLPGFANHLKASPGRHLILGHSNTTPDLVAALGGDPGTLIDEGSEYDRLYIVTVLPDATVTTVLLRYGAPYPG